MYQWVNDSSTVMVNLRTLNGEWIMTTAKRETSRDTWGPPEHLANSRGWDLTPDTMLREDPLVGIEDRAKQYTKIIQILDDLEDGRIISAEAIHQIKLITNR